MNLEEAEKIVYFIANGRKIAIVAATQIERSYSYTKEATKDSPGVLKTLKPDKFTEVIRKAKSNSDIVIAYPHWGTEGNHSYGADQKELAEAFVSCRSRCDHWRTHTLFTGNCLYRGRTGSLQSGKFLV